MYPKETCTTPVIQHRAFHSQHSRSNAKSFRTSLKSAVWWKRYVTHKCNDYEESKQHQWEINSSENKTQTCLLSINTVNSILKTPKELIFYWLTAIAASDKRPWLNSNSQIKPKLQIFTGKHHGKAANHPHQDWMRSLKLIKAKCGSPDTASH